MNKIQFVYTVRLHSEPQILHFFPSHYQILTSLTETLELFIFLRVPGMNFSLTNTNQQNFPRIKSMYSHFLKMFPPVGIKAIVMNPSFFYFNDF